LPYPQQPTFSVNSNIHDNLITCSVILAFLTCCKLRFNCSCPLLSELSILTFVMTCTCQL
jgi:hypothetical protein